MRLSRFNGVIKPRFHIDRKNFFDSFLHRKKGMTSPGKIKNRKDRHASPLHGGTPGTTGP
jgi:hypothetical protein